MRTSLFIFCCLALLYGSKAFSQADPVHQIQLSQFQLQSSAVLHADGRELSTPGYTEKEYWFPVTVPCTVLTGLVANHVYPDPYTGMNNMLIPDASDSFNREYGLEKYSYLPNEPNPWKKPYWYKTQFSVPASERGRLFQLLFKGINYRAEVWLNGTLLADSSQMAGMFAEYSLDATRHIIVGGRNFLAVKIYPLDEPGLPAAPQLKALGDFYANGGPSGDIGKNVTMLCSVGWDWMPAVRDRNMGIWQPVFLRSSGHVLISQPQVITQLAGETDTSRASVLLKLALDNRKNSISRGKLIVSIQPETFSGTPVRLEKTVQLEANSVNPIALDPLSILHPHCWWPNGYGRPDLYRVRLQYAEGATVFDDTSFLFGIRTVSTRAETIDGWVRREFLVNGRKVHLDGGAWVPDMMLNRDSLRYDNELQLCRNANINLVRIWGGGIAPPDVFFELADRYGLLIWQDFWVTGDTHGEFKGSADYPYRGDIYVNNIISTICRIRNHPSLLLWTGGNEGHARKELYTAMRDNVAALDGTRPFIPSSSGFARQPAGWPGSWPDNQPSGVYSGGPYSWQEPKHYYELVNRGRDWLFKDETGIPSQPPYSSLPKIINNLVPDSSLPFPLNNTWGYHDACTGNGHYETYYQAMVDRYGPPATIRGFSTAMQLMNADGYRGIFEAAGSRLQETGGVMLWKLNAAFPSVIWQVYDWYLQPNAGYYFMQQACAPLHIQLNLGDSTVEVVNRNAGSQNQLNAVASIYDINGHALVVKQQKLNAGGACATRLFSLAGNLKTTPAVSFICLKLTGADGRVISQNTYWLARENRFQALKQMPSARVSARIIGKKRQGRYTEYSILLSNPSQQLAFFINAQLKQNNEELRPCLWSNNYVTLEPGASITLTARLPFTSSGLQLAVSGWNVPELSLTL